MRSNLSQEQKLAKALEGLEELKQKIIELRFGLCNAKPLTTREVAKVLSSQASPQTILKFASHHKHDDGSVSFSEKDVACLEAQALRDLARPGHSQPIAYQETSDGVLADKRGKRSSRSKSVVAKAPNPKRRINSDSGHRGLVRVTHDSSVKQDSSTRQDPADTGIKTKGRRVHKTTKSGDNIKKLGKVA